MFNRISEAKKNAIMLYCEVCCSETSSASSTGNLTSVLKRRTVSFDPARAKHAIRLAKHHYHIKLVHDTSCTSRATTYEVQQADTHLDSSTNKSAASTKRQSAGMRSPLLISTTSPGTSSRAIRSAACSVTEDTNMSPWAHPRDNQLGMVSLRQYLQAIVSHTCRRLLKGLIACMVERSTYLLWGFAGD